MTVLFNNTILSNFSIAERPDLVRAAFEVEQTATVETVSAEHEKGLATGRFPKCDWSWLPVLTLTAEEQKTSEQFSRQLGAGERACLAVTQARNMKFATDDLDARNVAQRLGIPITGTIGILAILVKDQKLALQEADSLLKRMITLGFHAPFDSVKSVLE